MTLCILGQEKTESNLKLLQEAKRKFKSVFFVPVESIGVGLSEKFSITYRTSDLLKFNAIFPRVPRKFYSYAYQLLSLFPKETFMPIPPIAFLLASERFFLLTVLKKRGVETLNLHLARSGAAKRMLDSMDFPVVLRVPTQKTGVTVKGKTEAKSIIEALGSLEHPILIEKPVKKGMISAYVANNEVIAAVKKKSREKDVVFSPGDLKRHKLSMEARQLAVDAALAIDTQVMRVDMSGEKDPQVVNVELNPDLMAPSRATGVNIPEKVMDAVYESYMAHIEKPALMRFFEDANSVVKEVLEKK